MPGDMEQPLNLTFQPQSFLSGSISFGRFENENLSWERRSSFSHNRYLEEVEKCSKPGSVKEKKAYLEAHFKKIALLRQTASDSHSGTSENEASDCLDYRYQSSETSDNVDYRWHTSETDNLDHKCQTSENVSSHTVNNKHQTRENDAMDYSDEDLGHERQCINGSHSDDSCESSESQVEPVLNNIHVITEESDLKEVHCHVVKDESKVQVMQDFSRDNAVVNNDKPEMKVEQDPMDNAIDVELSEDADASLNDGILRNTEEASSECWQNPSQQLGDVAEAKSIKNKSKAQSKANQVHRSIIGGASEVLHHPNGMKRDSKMKTNKQSSKISSIQTSEGSESSISISKPGYRSEKQLKTKKLIEPLPSTSKEVESRYRPTTNRTRRTIDLTKPDVKSNAPGFSFKSHERAEKRKEYFMKLEEKMHAKEAEMNQIQARTLEKTEAELKQLRKSLNFKATPMPSFYHAPGSNANQVVPTKPKPTRVRTKTATLGKRSENDQTPSRSQPVSQINPPKAINPATESSSSRSQLSERVKKSERSTKKESDKDGKFPKPKVTKSETVAKTEGKERVRGRRSSKQMVRKESEGVGIGRHAGTSHLAVGVAS